MKKLHNFINEATHICLTRSTQGVRIPEVVEYAYSAYPEEVAEYAETLTRSGIEKLVRLALRRTEKDDGVESQEPAQLGLPGFKFPTSVAIPQADGDYLYIRFENLTGNQLLRAIATRRQSIALDQKRLQDFEDKYAELRSYLLRSETMTVKEAALLYQQDRQAMMAK